MKVLHVAESIRGGCGTYLNELVPLQQAALGHKNVRVLAPLHHAMHIPLIAPDVVQYFDGPARSARSLMDVAWSLRSFVRSYRPDVIHAHSTFAGLIARMLYGWNRRDRTVVYCPHSWSFNSTTVPARQFLFETAERLMSRLCDDVVAISNHEAREGVRIGIPAARIRMIYNGLAADAPPAADCVWEDSRLKILFVGRLDKQKGFDLLCEAVRGLDKTVHVRAVGEAVRNSGFKPHNTPDNIELLGWRSEAEITGLLAKADIVVMPSRWEGFGLVAAEAMRAGRPVVAAAVGGLPEVVEDGVTGLIVPPESPAAIRDAIVAFDPARAAEMGAAGRQRFERLFTADRMSRELLELYRDGLNRRRSTTSMVPGMARWMRR